MSTAKLQILKETFNNAFSIESYQKFVREFFNGPNMIPIKRDERIWLEYKKSIEAYYKIANYEDNDNKKILILAVELKKSTTVEKARSLQRNFISKILDGSTYEAAIVAFYTPFDPNWRLSLVRLDYTFTNKGVKLELTPAKRYSYLVGENEPNHTAQAQLLKIFEDDNINPTLEDIEEAFSVEKVTKDFFNAYKAKYLDLKEYLESNEEFIKETSRLGFELNKFAEQFSKKLMGQLAFLYFLQKKGWLGVRLLPENRTITKVEFQQIYDTVGQANKNVLNKAFKPTKDGKMRATAEVLHSIVDYEMELLSDCFINTRHNMPWGSGDRNFIRGLFDFCTSQTKHNFFDYYLEPFFYDALNKKRKHHYFKLFNCKIPFLNGGLFEPLEGYHWRDVNFEIPNSIFSNKDSKGRDADGILDVFDRFNFTMNEDEPLEKEVAIDPEMLGKIFENLLDVSDRKSKGAFYTPREIVHYMCQESLINYLVNKVKVPYDDIKEFILYGEMIRDSDSSINARDGGKLTIKPSIYNNIVAIDEALKNVKVADPAVGSGAFPLGMLNEIVKARSNITEYIVRVNSEGEFGRVYTEEFIRSRRSEYQMKWDTIKNSIFAVDIEPSAVDIAKLRLWLSVVVEQEIDGNNPEPHPLPNLDQNIMVGNSLIDEYEGIKLFDETILYKNQNKDVDKKTTDFAIQMNMLLDESDQLIKEMFDLQDRYFGEDNEEVKNDVKKRIDKNRDELIRYKLLKEGNTEGLKRYEESLKNKTKPYFIWELEFAKIFKENGGFDIVVGNPPYVGEKGNKAIFREIAKTDFGKRCYQGKMDLFYFFFHLALDIGNSISEIAFITTNYYLTATGGTKLRMDIKNRSSIRKLINFYELSIFETAKGQHNMITILTKIRDMGILANTCITKRKGVFNSNILNEIINFSDKDTEYYSNNQEALFDSMESYIRISGINKDTIDSDDSILLKIKDNGDLLNNLASINQGIVTGCDRVTKGNIDRLSSKQDVIINDGIFVLDLLNNRDKIVASEIDNGKSLLKNFYKNSDIKRYWSSLEPTKKIIYYTEDLDGRKYPDLVKHMNKFRGILESRLEKYNANYHWTGIHRARNKEIFIGPKIICPQRSTRNNFAYNEVDWFSSADVYYITQPSKKISLKYVIALLNSKTYYFWLYHYGKRKGKMLELYQKPLSEIPIKIISNSEQVKFINIVDRIFELTTQLDYLDNLDSQTKVNNYENVLNEMVYSLYEFTENEISIIENLYKS